MIKIWINLIFAFALIVLPLVNAENSTGTLSVHGAWVREAPPNAVSLAGYMEIVNSGSEERSVVSAESPTFQAIELHRSIVLQGIARMVPQESIPIPAGGNLALKPGDYHMMLMNPNKALKAGDKVSATLTFDNGERLVVTLEVKKGEGVDPEHQHHHH